MDDGNDHKKGVKKQKKEGKRKERREDNSGNIFRMAKHEENNILP